MDEEIQKIIHAANHSHFAGIFINKEVQIDHNKPVLIIIAGPTGSGKSTFTKYLSAKYPKVKTATTRHEKREDENEESFLWINESPKEYEKIEDFQKEIEEKYGLIESNIYAGNIYGVPESEMYKAIADGIAILSIENNGAKKVISRFKEELNIIVFFVLPDSKEQLRKRIVTNRNDIEQRLKTAESEIHTSYEFTNYYIHNTELNLYAKNENPLKYTEKQLAKFIDSIIT